MKQSRRRIAADKLPLPSSSVPPETVLAVFEGAEADTEDDFDGVEEGDGEEKNQGAERDKAREKQGTDGGAVSEGDEDEGDEGLRGFVAGQLEKSAYSQFALSQKLYGREKEIKLLTQAYERAALGAREVVFVAGPSGIGMLFWHFFLI